MQPKQARQHRPKAQALSEEVSIDRSSNNRDRQSRRRGEKGKTKDLLCGVAGLVGNAGHGALATCRAVSGGRTAAQRGNGGRVLILGAALLLGRHARVSEVLLAGLGTGIHLLLVGAGGSSGVGLRWVLRLAELGLLLLVLDLVGVLVVDGRLLARDVWRQWVLVHGDYIVALSVRAVRFKA